MDKVIYFDNDNQHRDYCVGKVYFDFLDYAFSKTDYFMLVYVNYYGKGYSEKQKYFKKALNPFKVKCRTNPSWPGTPKTLCSDTTYKIIFYKNHPKAKEILKEVSSMSSWSRPSYPEDLAFFKGNKCWFYSTAHETIAAIIHADEDDLYFLETSGLASRNKAFTPQNNYFKMYDEDIT